MSETTEASRENSYVPGMGHDRLLPLYDPLHRLLGMSKLHRLLLDQAGIRPGHRVLEVGCGTGNLSILAKSLHPDAEIVGLDPDPKALARACRKAEREALLVRLDRGFAEELPYPEASFDRVLSAFMFHHLTLDEKERALREIRRVLKPGGSLHLLDLVGAKEPSSGLTGVIARLFHRTHLSQRHDLLQDNLGDRLPTLMLEASFTDPTEVDHRVKKLVGHITYYRASAPHAKSRST